MMWHHLLLQLLWALQLVPGNGKPAMFQGAYEARSQLTHNTQLGRESTGEAITSCLNENMRLMNVGCGGLAGNGTQHIRSSLILHASLSRALFQCVPELTNSWARKIPLRLLMIPGTVAQAVQAAISLYSNITYPVLPPVVCDTRATLTDFAWAARDSMLHASDPEQSHAMWFLHLGATGDGVAAGIFKDLTLFVPASGGSLRAETLIPVVRSLFSLYNSKMYNIPLSAYSILLYYRKDIYSQLAASPPNTWWQLLDVAAQMNGTQGMYSMCLNAGPFGDEQLGPVLFRYILASHTQSRGTHTGWLIDPDTMDVLLDTPAAIEALNIMKALISMLPPSGSKTSLANGQCIMELSTPLTFKNVARASSTHKFRGQLGVAQVPGSLVTLDRTTNTLQHCTEATCPCATWHVNGSDGHMVLVNRAPGLEALGFAINNKMSATRQFETLASVGFLATPEFSSQFVFDPKADVYPIRQSQLDPSEWIAAGYHAADVHEFCTAMSTALQHPNLQTQMRAPGGSWLALIQQAIAANISAPNSSADAVAQDSQARCMNALLMTTSNFLKGSLARLKREYRKSLNIQDGSKLVVYPAPDVVNATVSPQNSKTTVILLCVLLPAVTAAVLVAALFRMLWWKQAVTIKHPLPGPETTLLVTDIENSTNLWESVECEAVDCAIKLHDALVRRLAASTQGYESGWEGDSFILAFHTPHTAMQFASLLQQELLHLPWPTELLASPHAQEVWLQHAKVCSTVLIMDSDASSPQGIGWQLKGLGGDQMGSMTIPAVQPTASVTLPYDEVWSVGRTPGRTPARAVSLQTRFSTADSTPDVLTGTKAVSATYLWPAWSATSTSKYLLDKAQTQVAGACSREGACLGQTYQAAWTLCESGTHGGVLAYKGLRVRVGLHAGMCSANDKIGYNSVMRHHNYSGPLRVMSNAIAAAGHGGQTLLSTQTTEVLSADNKSQGLPPDCQLYSFGRHQIDGVDNPVDVLCMLPRSLACRLAVFPPQLRYSSCWLPGCLAAPVPSEQRSVFLVAVKLVGLSSLLEWDHKETTTAVAAARECALQGAASWNGVVSEDGWADVCTSGSSKASPTGRMVLAFTSAHASLGFVLELRSHLLMLDWSERLLSHSACDHVSSNAPAVTWHKSERRTPRKTHSGRLRASLVRLLHNGSGINPPEGHVTASGTHGFEIKPMQTAGTWLERDEETASHSDGTAHHGPTVSAAGTRDSFSTLAADGSARRGSERKLSAQLSGFRRPPGEQRSTSFTASEEKAQRDKQQQHTVMASNPPMLRGLRIQSAVATGPLQMSVAVKTSGRPVYTGKGAKLLEKLLKLASAGQIVSTHQVVEAAQQPVQ